MEVPIDPEALPVSPCDKSRRMIGFFIRTEIALWIGKSLSTPRCCLNFPVKVASIAAGGAEANEATCHREMPIDPWSLPEFPHGQLCLFCFVYPLLWATLFQTASTQTCLGGLAFWPQRLSQALAGILNPSDSAAFHLSYFQKH